MLRILNINLAGLSGNDQRILLNLVLSVSNSSLMADTKELKAKFADAGFFVHEGGHHIGIIKDDITRLQIIDLSDTGLCPGGLSEELAEAWRAVNLNRRIS